MSKKQENQGEEQQPSKKSKQKRRAHGEGSVHQRKDGRWQADMTLENGRRRYFYGKTKKEALDKMHKAQQDQRQGTLIEASQQTLEAFMKQWLQAKRLELKDGTFVYYKSFSQNYIIPTLGNIRLQKLTESHIQTVYLDLLEEEDLSVNTIRLIHAVLRNALDAAVKMRKITSNPANLVTLPKAVKKELAFLTIEQAQKLLEVAHNHKLETLLTIAIATGMRQGELLALRWSDIDFQKGTVHVIRSLSYRNPDETGARHKEEEPKTASSKRTIPLPDFAVDALQRHRVRQLEQRLQSSEWEEKGLVFPNAKGGYLWLGPMRAQFRKLLEEAGLPRIRFHDLRHSAATILLAMGVSPKVIQERLGHSNISTTLGVYGHVTESMQKEAIDKLNDQFQRPEEGQN